MIDKRTLATVTLDRVFGRHHPNDGREWECQCARCGGSLNFEECEICNGGGVTGHECGEDCCCCLDPEDNIVCDCCGGEGNYPLCLSQASGWCLDHPMNGREHIDTGTPEWFPVKANGRADPQAARGKDCHD